MTTLATPPAWSTAGLFTATSPAPPHHFSIQVYVTTGLTASTAGLLPTALLHKLQLAWGELVWLRLDVCFLPACSSPEICMAHYRAEKEARKNERLQVMPSHAQYASDSANFLIMVERFDWEAEDGVLSTVRFDPPEEYLTHPDEGLCISKRVVYEEGVPILQPKNWREWIMANAGKTPVGAKCGELHHACRKREEYKERYVEEVEKMEEERKRG